jgi:NAD+ diphosphatase
MTMTFQRTYPGSTRNAQTTHWYLVQGDKLLFTMRDGALALPDQSTLDALALNVDNALHFGADAGADFVALPVDANMTLPAGHRTFGLRDLYGRVDDRHYAAAGYAVQLATWQRNSRFCMRCGAALLPMAREWGKRCPDETCGWSMYPPVNPCTITLIHDGESVLLTHKEGWGPRYGLVAGFVEPGESLEDNLRREVAEEVGVSVDAIEYFKSQPWPFPHQIMLGFFARYAAGDVRIDTEELDDAQWFHIDALPQIPPPLSIARQLLNTWAARLGRDISALPMR